MVGGSSTGVAVGVNWQQVEQAYADLQAARTEPAAAILWRISEMQLVLSDALDDQVMEVVQERRWSWQMVADALGVTRQAASKRWASRVLPRG